jgi:FKBP-type peptidyl-prolyl cis-trans isomerase FkpA
MGTKAQRKQNNMKKATILGAAIAAMGAFASCKGKVSYEKTSSGLMYKIISDKKNPLVAKGDFLKVHYEQKIRDSILFSTYTSMPDYVMVDSIGAEYSPLEVFPKLRLGDSLVVVQIVDSLVNKSMGMMPPFMKKGDQLILSMKVLGVLKDQMAVEADREKENNAFMAKEQKELEGFLSSKKINAQPAGEGVFVEVLQQGNGIMPDSGKSVSVMYTGTLLDGQVFDTNLDTAKNPSREPLTFTVGQQAMIPGFEKGIRLLQKGAKAKIYVPSTLGYGRRPVPNGKGYDNLIFEVEVLDIK